ncbi:probable flavin-containing monooxygenase 1 [Salvia miltiorrhiza]|uniref:probable flavin-containing monooxygenase 1 n=1 Tax=Salvia miltiorrhiza TaxID=226208 RepID=UPI0025AD2CCC|nr:probable flavin-containing monooxygenase 1 [Salvia miltiorrhiza]
MEKRVAIVGAGISGLLACKYAAARGFTPMVFEAQDHVGGLWNHTIESTRLQNARVTFQFSDFPWPRSVEDMFPTNFQVVEYLQSYAQNFGLLPYMRFNSKVMSIDYVGESEEEMRSWELWGAMGKPFGSKGKWILKVFHSNQNFTQEYEAEFVIICIGRFSGLPDIPKFAAGFGPEIFSGKVLHSMDFSDMDNAAAADFIKGKRVAIIGSGKTAVDTAFECANANGTDYPCTMIQRTPHWALPNAFPWGVHFGYFCATRFSELMVHKPGEGLLFSVLATLLKPLRWAMSKFVESYIRWKLPLKKYGMIPPESFLQEVSSCQIYMLPQTFYDKVENGSIVLKKSQNLSFCKDGLIIDGQDANNPIKADVVIFATGYKGDEKLKNIFASPTFQSYILGTPASTIPLYRQIIHPRIPGLAAIGYSESASNLYTFEMRCKWLAHFLDEALQLPSIKEMEKEVEMWERYMKRYSANGKYRRGCIAGLHIWYNDQLCRDIGVNPRRKKGFFADMFQPYGLPDYNGITPNDS